MYIVAEYLVDKNVPTFFIDRDLLQAVAILDPPDEFRWTELKLPFEAALVMLARGFLSFTLIFLKNSFKSSFVHEFPETA